MPHTCTMSVCLLHTTLLSLASVTPPVVCFVLLFCPTSDYTERRWCTKTHSQADSALLSCHDNTLRAQKKKIKVKSQSRTVISKSPDSFSVSSLSAAGSTISDWIWTFLSKIHRWLKKGSGWRSTFLATVYPSTLEPPWQHGPDSQYI